ncbi:MAG: serine/threonine-protein kinase [Planctomycetota bacterium]
MDQSWERTKAIFGEASDLDGPARSAYIEAACGPDQELRRRVDGLLGALGRAGTFMGDPTHTEIPATGDSPFDVRPGSTFGPYTIVERIGEGGFGTVFVADQAGPVARRVALKILKAGMDSREILSRFDTERRTLAMMDHPGIARIDGAGVTPSGRPYFAMELVRGVPITEYADINALTTRERLGLLCQVCAGVQHAHHKGVIHRDLKPSNILVTLVDGVPTPKIIDFGIAKALGDSGPAVTAFHAMMGTPAYMSPEQAELSSDQIDTRSDIYSLGAVLYELLTGQTPFGAELLSKAAGPELQRLLRDHEPGPPSTKVTAAAARSRRTQPGALRRVLRGDLDWIVMRCLEKRPSRRYDSAYALAEDLRRYLAHEPVTARPPTVGYRVAKFVRRNRTLTIAGAAVLLTACVGAGFAVAGFLEARKQRTDALASADRAIEQAEKAIAVRMFLTDMFHSADARLPDGDRAITVLEVLSRAAAKLNAGAFPGKPGVEAAVRLAVAQTYRSMGQLEESLAHATRARELLRTLPATRESDSDLKEALNSIAAVQADRKNFAETESAIREAMEIETRGAGVDTPDYATLLNNLAGAVVDLGRTPEAEELYRRSLDIRERTLGPTHPLVGASLNNLGYLLYQSGRKVDGAAAFERSLAILRSETGRSPTEILYAINNTAFVLEDIGKAQEAAQLFAEGTTMARKALGDEHPLLATMLANSGRVARGLGKPQQAIAMARECLAIRRKIMKPTDPPLSDALYSLGMALADTGEPTEVLALLEECMTLRRAILAPDNPRIAAGQKALDQARLKAAAPPAPPSPAPDAPAK